ncbi:transposase [Robertmurraya sp. DFI.2.37]|nr:transposase [Robertmurraya sp. DFI.2.37]MDF1509000.1 transposase [Robertmurraya sp. DFI.2.37]
MNAVTVPIERLFDLNEQCERCNCPNRGTIHYVICPNGRKVLFKKYQHKTNRSGYEQNFKIYECEDCTGCPLKTQCTKAKGNRQVHWNPIFEEMKAKAKTALECKEKAGSNLRSTKHRNRKRVRSHQGQSVVP